MDQANKQSHLPNDPIKWVSELEAIWKSHDGIRAAEGYTDDAVLYWGANQTQSGKALRERPAKWFAFAIDLQIDKTYIAHTENCIVTTWDSNYTDSKKNKKIFERGIEYFYFRDGKIYEQHAWQSSWTEDEISQSVDFSTD